MFPFGLIHFQLNIGRTHAVAIAALSSQDPGVVTVANAVFGSAPPVNPEVLIKAFRLGKLIKPKSYSVHVRPIIYVQL